MSARLESLRRQLLLLQHKNVWSKQDYADKDWLQDEIAKLEIQERPAVAEAVNTGGAVGTMHAYPVVTHGH